MKNKGSLLLVCIYLLTAISLVFQTFISIFTVKDKSEGMLTLGFSLFGIEVKPNMNLLDCFDFWKRIVEINDANFVYMVPFYLIFILLLVAIVELVILIAFTIKFDYGKQTSASGKIAIVILINWAIELCWMLYVDLAFTKVNGIISFMVSPFFIIGVVMTIAIIVVNKQYEKTMYYVNANSN